MPHLATRCSLQKNAKTSRPISSVLSSFFKKKIFDTLMVLIKYYLFISSLNLVLICYQPLCFHSNSGLLSQRRRIVVFLFIVLRYFKGHLNALFYRQKKNLSLFLPIKTTQENLSRKAASPPITRITNLDRFDHEVEFMNPKSI